VYASVHIVHMHHHYNISCESLYGRLVRSFARSLSKIHIKQSRDISGRGKSDRQAGRQPSTQKVLLGVCSTESGRADGAGSQLLKVELELQAQKVCSQACAALKGMEPSEAQ
jgi:hypothetical protein